MDIWKKISKKSDFLGKINWNQIKKIGGSRIVNSLYIWIFIVPIAAKFFSKLPPEFTFCFHSQKITFPIGLPFNWGMFYISALLFVIGYIIYILRSPKIIKDFQTFRDFEIQGHGERELRFFIVEYIFNIKNKKYSD